MDKNNFAFPFGPYANPTGQNGLTKREYFAAAALTGIMAAYAGPDIDFPHESIVSKMVVEYADAVLEKLK